MSLSATHWSCNWRVYHFYFIVFSSLIFPPAPSFSSHQTAFTSDSIAQIWTSLTLSSRHLLVNLVLAWPTMHSYPMFVLVFLYFSHSVNSDPGCWKNSKGDYCHWILNHDPLNKVEPAGEPPDSWTALTEIFMLWHSILQCPLDRVSHLVAEKIPLCYKPAAPPCHTF